VRAGKVVVVHPHVWYLQRPGVGPAVVLFRQGKGARASLCDSGFLYRPT